MGERDPGQRVMDASRHGLTRSLNIVVKSPIPTVETYGGGPRLRRFRRSGCLGEWHARLFDDQILQQVWNAGQGTRRPSCCTSQRLLVRGEDHRIEGGVQQFNPRDQNSRGGAPVSRTADGYPADRLGVSGNQERRSLVIGFDC
jgi:hypothetical protein